MNHYRSSSIKNNYSFHVELENTLLLNEEKLKSISIQLEGPCKYEYCEEKSSKEKGLCYWCEEKGYWFHAAYIPQIYVKKTVKEDHTCFSINAKPDKSTMASILFGFLVLLAIQVGLIMKMGPLLIYYLKLYPVIVFSPTIGMIVPMLWILIYYKKRKMTLEMFTDEYWKCLSVLVTGLQAQSRTENG